MFDAAQAAGIIAGLGVAVFAIIALTPSGEFAIVVGAALQVIGYGGAVIGVVNNLYKLADFAVRVDKARTEQELKAAGDIFAEAVVGLGIDGVYKTGDPPRYVIVEAKYNTAGLEQGQMSDKWVIARLETKVGRDEALNIERAMDAGAVAKWKIQVREDGSTYISRIDRGGHVIRGNAGMVE